MEPALSFNFRELRVERRSPACVARGRLVACYRAFVCLLLKTGAYYVPHRDPPELHCNFSSHVAADTVITVVEHTCHSTVAQSFLTVSAVLGTLMFSNHRYPSICSFFYCPQMKLYISL